MKRTAFALRAAVIAVAIVLLHGTGASLHTWDGWVAALQQEHRVIRVDLPGFGLTGPSPDGRYGIAGYVSFVIALMDELQVRRAVIAGNSVTVAAVTSFLAGRNDVR
jgi:pimeloyl-ACP methyl ester carboxylesterase